MGIPPPNEAPAILSQALSYISTSASSTLLGGVSGLVNSKANEYIRLFFKCHSL